MKFSFDESARNELISFFQEALEKAGKETTELFEGLIDIYVREQYKPLGVMTNSVAQYYAGDFQANVRGQFQNWKDSETSLTAFANDLEASDNNSDDAYAAAQSVENAFQEILDDMLTKQPEIPDISQEAHLSKNLSEIFEEVDELVQKSSSAVEDLVSTYESRVESDSEENQLYANTNEILVAILTSYKSLFDVFKEGANRLASRLDESGNLAVEKSETDSEQMKVVAEAAGEALKDVSSLFNF